MGRKFLEDVNINNLKGQRQRHQGGRNIGIMKQEHREAGMADLDVVAAYLRTSRLPFVARTSPINIASRAESSLSKSYRVCSASDICSRPIIAAWHSELSCGLDPIKSLRCWISCNGLFVH